jgi:hypothetical protein
VLNFRATAWGFLLGGATNESISGVLARCGPTPKSEMKPGVDSESPERPEIEHFGNCDVCGALVDMRDLGQVLEHMHGHVPFVLTDRPDPEVQ